MKGRKEGGRERGGEREGIGGKEREGGLGGGGGRETPTQQKNRYTPTHLVELQSDSSNSLPCLVVFSLMPMRPVLDKPFLQRTRKSTKSSTATAMSNESSQISEHTTAATHHGNSTIQHNQGFAANKIHLTSTGTIFPD